MASTLIKRVCDPNQMTQQEKNSVIADRGLTGEGQLKLGLHATLAVMQEIRKGRMTSDSMLQWLTAEEYVDALAIVAAVTVGTFGQDEVKNLCLLGEYLIYPCAYIESILGL